MRRDTFLIDRLAPDSVSRLEKAAFRRFEDADLLKESRRWLTALYLYGYSIEMCLTAAFFRSAGFPPNQAIDRETRRRRMTEARRLTNAEGAPLMNSDPHPLVGWARFLEWHRCASALAVQEMRRLKDAVRWAESAYKHWRPELR
jgi:hypothetical protein